MDKKKFKLLVDESVKATIRHDERFRKNHNCQCKDRVEYSDGRWYCGEMLKSRQKDKAIQFCLNEIEEERTKNFPQECKDLLKKHNKTLDDTTIKTRGN